MKKNIHNIVAKLIDDLNEYYQQTEDSEILEVGSSIVGDSGVIRYKMFKSVIYRTETDRSGILEDHYMIGDEWDEAELLDQIAHDRKRLRKSWKVWKSDNPDAEMEKGEDED